MEIEKTEVAATTIHNMLELDGEYKSRLDFGNPSNAKVVTLLQLQCLLLDEVSMVDDLCFTSICECLSVIDHSRRLDSRGADCFGNLHILLFGDRRL